MPAEHKIGKQLLLDVNAAIGAERPMGPIDDEKARVFDDHIERQGFTSTRELIDFADWAFEETLRENGSLRRQIVFGEIEKIYCGALCRGIELGVAAEKRRAMEAMVDG